jgi:hypothetical protein
MSENQTTEEVKKIFHDLEEYYDVKEEERKNEEIWEVIFEKLKIGATSLQISKEFTDYYNAHKSNIHFYENYFSNEKYKSIEEEKEENIQKQERKLKRQRDSMVKMIKIIKKKIKQLCYQKEKKKIIN